MKCIIIRLLKSLYKRLSHLWLVTQSFAIAHIMKNISTSDISGDIFRKVVYPEGGATVLLLAMAALVFIIINVPLSLVIIDFESNTNRHSTLLTRLQMATIWIFVLWTAITLRVYSSASQKFWLESIVLTLSQKFDSEFDSEKPSRNFRVETSESKLLSRNFRVKTFCGQCLKISMQFIEI